jgi:hypothetical protein
MVGPLLDRSTASSSVQTPTAPPNYFSSSLSGPRPAIPAYSSGSSAQRPTLPPGVSLYDLLPSQIQCDIDSLSLTKPETNEEPIVENQKVCFTSYIYFDPNQSHIFTEESGSRKDNSVSVETWEGREKVDLLLLYFLIACSSLHNPCCLLSYFGSMHRN